MIVEAIKQQPNFGDPIITRATKTGLENTLFSVIIVKTRFDRFSYRAIHVYEDRVVYDESDGVFSWWGLMIHIQKRIGYTANQMVNNLLGDKADQWVKEYRNHKQ